MSRRGRGEGKSRALHVILFPSFVEWGVSLTRPVLESVSPLSGSGVSLTCPALESDSPFVVWGISLTSPVLACLVFGLLKLLTDRVMQSVGFYGDWGVCGKCQVLESVSSLESGEFLFTSPVLESVWSFVGCGGCGRGVSVIGTVLEPVGSVVVWGDSLSRPVLESLSSVGGWIVSFKRPVLHCV